MQLPDQQNDFLNQQDLQTLANMRSDQGPVFSLYLDLRPEKRAAGDAADRNDPADRSDPLNRFDRLLQAAAQQKKLDLESPAYQRQWEQEAGRLRSALERQLPLQAQPQAQGLAVFSCLPSGLWREFFLPAPVLDRLVVGTRPYVRPLALLLDEFRPGLVVLIDSGAARLAEISLAALQETASIEAVPVTGGAPSDSLRDYARLVAERTETAWREHGHDWLVIGGSQEPLSALREALSEPLVESLAGEMRLPPVTGLEDVLARVLEIEAGRERKLEEQRIKALTTAGSGAAVLGLEQTLLAVKDGRARLLIVEEDYHQAGGECPNCGYLGAGEEQQVCPICGVALRPDPDIVEAALKRLLDQGGEIEVLRSRETRRALESYGHIGALLRDGGTPPNKDSANRRPLSKDGKPQPDAIHDEAIEESFPASDPPGWTHS